ncbi:hypothetical protein [Streptomyces sp.]|uniref:hypothetical protein n=1 Tax=Streptomyces sp. TaxID=1931 RepID=UPI002F9541E0
MARTTPARAVDIARIFPELAPLARTTVRLHPRPGAPTADASSVGGPLLWPADEPWPTCPEHAGPWHVGYVPAEVRACRSVLTAGWGRSRDGRLSLTPQEREAVDRVGYTGRRLAQDGPVPLLAVLQLYARDLPEAGAGADLWPGPDGTDLLQVLWCPFEHGEDAIPDVRLFWRTASQVGPVLAEAPEPDVIGDDNHLPAPCVLHPEALTEYPAPLELPEELVARIEGWEAAEGLEHAYHFGLSVVHGWKLGGWGPWSFCDPWPMECPDCGGEVRPLLTVASGEWDGEGDWRPVEDSAPGASDVSVYPQQQEPTMITVGRASNLQIYRCTASVEHRPVSVLQ